MSISNQYIQRNILKHITDYEVFTTDDKDFPKNINISNNSPGFDLLLKTKNKYVRIQSKLRQVNGLNNWSKQVYLETTRRNSKKNINKNHTGHVCYSLNEFDFLFISLVNIRKSFKYREDCNKWSFCLIPINELEDKDHSCCVSMIDKNIIKKNIININNKLNL